MVELKNSHYRILRNAYRGTKYQSRYVAAIGGKNWLLIQDLIAAELMAKTDKTPGPRLNDKSNSEREVFTLTDRGVLVCLSHPKQKRPLVLGALALTHQVRIRRG